MSANNRITNGLEAIKGKMPSEAERKQAARREGALAKFSDDDAADIIAALKKKALAGDVGAARVCLAYLIGAPEAKPAPVTIGKIVFEQPAGVPKSLAKARERIVQLVAIEGPMDEQKIAVRTGLAKDVVEGLLEHEWFEDEQDGWHITNQARAEVIGDGD